LEFKSIYPLFCIIYSVFIWLTFKEYFIWPCFLKTLHSVKPTVVYFF
jgi:hypothetical protein